MLDEFLGGAGKDKSAPRGKRTQGRQGPSVNLCPHGEIYF